jgi:peptidylprolyl isomerase
MAASIAAVLDSAGMPRRLPALLVTLLLLTLGAAGCGGSGSGSSSSSEAQATSTPAPSPAQSIDAIARHVSHDLKTRPKILAPQGSPPNHLVIRDIVRGTGKPVKRGQTVSVQYVGASWSTGQEFDASWNRGQAFTFPLGAQQVIPGWDRGIPGMRPGGRRLLVIPSAQGYGTQGTPDGSIAPNETLIFVVDLVKARG